MDDPVGELRRQRELIAAHLRWLDEQIARTSAALEPAPTPPHAEAPASPSSPRLHASPPPPSGTVPPPPAASAASEIAMPEIDPGSVRDEVRRGCFIYVAIAAVLLAASIAVAVWIGGL